MTATTNGPAKALHLSNEYLRIAVHPDEGGRIASLRSLQPDVEFLTQAHSPRRQLKPSLNARFEEGACAGIEECLPSVAPCGWETAGGAIPDHGDFWQMEWNVERCDSRGAELSAMGFSRPLRFHKEVLLDDWTMRLKYRVQNEGPEPASFLYAFHPLFAVEPGDRIILPAEVRDLELYYSRGQRLATAGRVSWPLTADGRRLDIVQGADAGSAEMFYTARLRDSQCGLVRKAAGARIDLQFSVDLLAYLGVWICYGGWPEDSSYPAQYAVALEPTTAPCNSLREAQDSETAMELEPGSCLNWEIGITVQPEGGE